MSSFLPWVSSKCLLILWTTRCRCFAIKSINILLEQQEFIIPLHLSLVDSIHRHRVVHAEVATLVSLFLIPHTVDKGGIFGKIWEVWLLSLTTSSWRKKPRGFHKASKPASCTHSFSGVTSFPALHSPDAFCHLWSTVSANKCTSITQLSMKSWWEALLFQSCFFPGVKTL